MEGSEDKQSLFFRIIAIIGAILIFVGVAVLIAWNWDVIPDALKTIILISATFASFVSGFFFKETGYKGTGRALMALGALLYVLSLALISQIYHLATSFQHYTWLAFLAWTVIMLTAYFLDSRENLIISMILFFPWSIMQYLSIFDKFSSSNGALLGVSLIFLAAGILLYGVSIFHRSRDHKFANIYSFWTAFYFLSLFYALSFQDAILQLSGYSIESTFNWFLILFVIGSILAFIITTLLSSNKNGVSMKEIFGFLVVIIVLLSLLFLTKLGGAGVGYCSLQDCSQFRTDQQGCNSAPEFLSCEWYSSGNSLGGFCSAGSCSMFQDESSCLKENDDLYCRWYSSESYSYCTDVYCGNFDNNESECKKYPVCNWTPSEQTDLIMRDAGYGSQIPPAPSYSTSSRCENINCYEFYTEEGCNSAPENLNCKWLNKTDNSNYYQVHGCQRWSEKVEKSGECTSNNNNQEGCDSLSYCYWRPKTHLSRSDTVPFGVWFTWILNNMFFIIFILLIIAYGQYINSTKIINLSFVAFVLEILTRYIGFFMDAESTLAFSLLSIFGGIILIAGSWLIPKWRKSVMKEVSPISSQKQNSFQTQ